MQISRPSNLKNRLIGTGLGAIMAFATLVGASAQATTKTINEGKLTVGSDLTYPPYVYMENGTPAGFDADIMRLLAEEMSLEPVFVDTRFPDLILGMRAHRFDVVASALYVTPERYKLVNYVPYLKTGSSMIVLSDSSYTPATVEDLCGKKVSSIKGASWTPKLNRVSDDHCKKKGEKPISVLEYPTSPEALMALKSNAADVMMEDAAVSHELVEQQAGSIKVTSTDIIYPIVIALGVNKDATEMADALETALDGIKSSGKYDALLEKYGLDAPTPEDVEASLASTD